MALSPDITDRIARARADLRMGVPVVLTATDGIGAVVLAAETAGKDRLAALRSLGAPVLVLTARRAATLHARAYDGDLARVVLPAEATLDWIRAMADPADDLHSPMKGPFRTERDGPTDLHRAAINLVKAARLLPAALVLPLSGAEGFAARLDLTRVPVGGVLLNEPGTLSRVASASLPLEISDAGRLHIFRPADGGEEHYAVEIGQPGRDRPVLARLHSACFTGDVLGSLKCDCGPQLRGALAQMGSEGAGVLLYLNQEGRGIGLANKMRAYSLQDQGFDTVEANHRLGFEDDERDFRSGAAMLRQLGFSQVRLMTNNPAKVARLGDCGMEVVERVPLRVATNRHNADYLATKAAKSGHLL
ncbi:MAG: GTP cyclohydrolase II [Rubellimicrobium sp.]|nr:GTP cyclohydrolase II [Rubellimicrobium sp.]